MNTLVFGNEAFSLNAADLYSTIRWTPEVAFEDLTRLAACVCQTPIALLGLIEAKSWYVKSQIGIDPGMSHGYLALCTEVLKQQRYGDALVFGVPDTFLDHPFAHDEKITTSPNVQFYAGVPLLTPHGQLLGILSVFDSVPRELT
ncbi:MAG TPA: GAF domain-containing protein [Coleofasciculaceae cyanobacterium]